MSALRQFTSGCSGGRTATGSGPSYGNSTLRPRRQKRKGNDPADRAVACRGRHSLRAKMRDVPCERSGSAAVVAHDTSAAEARGQRFVAEESRAEFSRGRILLLDPPPG